MDLRLVVRYGIYGFVGIALFFVLMKLFGLERVAILRFFNLAIVIWLSNRLARRNLHENPQMEYFPALATLFLANAITVILSIVGFAIYINFIDPPFMNNFKDGIFWIGNIPFEQAAAALFMEGLAGSMIVSFATMQFYKDMKPSQRSKLPIGKEPF